MVPSDLSNNPTSSRHARLKLRNPGDSCALALVLPDSEFLPSRINAPDRASRLTPDRNPRLGTTFRSLETTARYRATFPRSKLLAYPFGSTLEIRRTRSITPLLHAIWLAPHSANSSRATRCPVPSLTAPTVLQLSTPAWGFSAPPDQSVQTEYQPRSSPNRPARSPSLPAACCD